MSEAQSTLVIGAARSGKSAFAERLAAESGLAPAYIATATTGDDPEMERRVALHRARRPEDWVTIEAPVDLATVLMSEAGPGRVLLVDCLTLWLANLMHADRDLEHDIDHLAGRIRHLAGPAILVSNEVGSGIVPENALARRYRDWHGRMNQIIAAACQRVVLVAAGLPMIIKPTSHPEIRL